MAGLVREHDRVPQAGGVESEGWRFMAPWLIFLLVPGQQVESDDFPKALQMKAVTASVRIVNRTERMEASGVILGRKEGALYILTAGHLQNRPGRLSVRTYTADSYPEAARVYDKAEVAARAKDVRDLALLRVETDDPPPGTLPLCPERLLPAKGPFSALSVGCGGTGAPVCLLETVREARFIRLAGRMETALFWETAGEQTPGRSGGPLIDRQGNILGLASGTNEGKGYYCHAREIHRWLKAQGFGLFLEAEEKRTSP